MEMEDDQYAFSDLRHLMTAPPRNSHFPSSSSSSIPHHHADLASVPASASAYRHHHSPYDLIMMMPRHDPTLLPQFRSSDSTSTVPSAVVVSSAPPPAATAFEIETDAPSLLVADSATARWPRQETLTLLDIRSRLDSKFKEANQKGPLWDEVSRIMGDEHNYQRSGKKCREKFENLYKYYKKTKEGKAGRQDGKNYRFFRQLEALYGAETSSNNNINNNNIIIATSSSLHPDNSHFVGDHNNLRPRFQHHNNNGINNNNNNNNNMTAGASMSRDEARLQEKHYCDSLSFSNTSEFETSSASSDDLGSVGVDNNNDDSVEKIRRKRRGGKCWKAKIKRFIDSQMRKLIDKQETWLEKLMKTLEQKEKDRMAREEDWRRQEVLRIDRERSFWAKERAWIEARDATLMEALQKLTGRELRRDQYNSSPDHGLIAAEHHRRNNSDNQNEDGSEILNNNNNNTTRELPDNDNNYERKTTIMDQGINKKRKENSRSSATTTYNLYFQTDSSLYGGGEDEMKEQSPNSSNAGRGNGGGSHVVQDSCFRFLMGEGDQTHQSGLWENFGLKLNNSGSDQT